MTAGIKANVDGSAAIQVGGTDVIGLGSTGNINFPVSGQRITGDFSNATVANRAAFQTSTTNANTVIPFFPNGTGNNAGVLFYNATDTANSSRLDIRVTSSEASLTSAASGTGTALPMTFYTGGSERARIDTSGNLQFNSGYGSVATAYGCRAWVNFNGTGTVAIRASGNVSSITDNGTGDYTVNFTNAMPDANYNAVSMGQRNDFNNGDMNISFYGNVYGTAIGTGSVRVNSAHASSYTLSDALTVCVAIFR